ncbi:hypothetical protein B7463_g11384, partial [Scytalidium lignicola]
MGRSICLTPGTRPGHPCGLARVTSRNAGQARDTFILFGGDVCHFCGMLRPNHTHPFPKSKFPSAALRVADINDLDVLLRRHPRFLSTSRAPAADSIEPARVSPWCLVSTTECSAYEDPATAQATLNNIREAFDEAENVLVAVAHDNNLLLKNSGKYVLPTLNDLPEEDINGWYEKGWKEKLYWSWLGLLGKEDKNGEIKPMEPHVIGYWKNGKEYDKAEEILDEVKQQWASTA